MKHLITFLCIVSFYSPDVFASRAADTICSKILVISDGANLPNLARFFIEDSSARREYILAKSVLNNNQFSYHGRSYEEQKLLVDSAYTKAIQEMAELLQRDPGLLDLPSSEFIRIAKANVDLGIGMPVLDIARYQLHLLKMGIDPLSRPKNLGSLFINFQFPVLIHRTTFESLVAILKSGVLAPRKISGVKDNYEGSDPEYLYLEAYHKSEEPRLVDPEVRQTLFSEYPKAIRSMFKGETVYLEIDSSAIDVGGFSHMSADWLYGKFIENQSIRGTYELASFLNSIDRSAEGFGLYRPRTEVLLTKPISVREFLRGINVQPDQVEVMQQRLRDAGVDAELIELVK